MDDAPNWPDEKLEKARAVLAAADPRVFHLDPTLPKPIQVKQALEQPLAWTSALSNEVEWKLHRHGLRT